MKKILMSFMGFLFMNVNLSEASDEISNSSLSTKLLHYASSQEGGLHFLQMIENYQLNQELSEISAKDNNGTTPIRILYEPHERERALAVFKEGHRVIKESFVSFFVKHFGLNNVAPSYLVKELSLNKELFSGLVEQFVPIIPEGISLTSLDTDVRAFIKRYQHSSGALSLLRVLDESIKLNRLEEDIKFLMDHLYLEGVQKYFMLYLLILGADMVPRNAMLQVTPDSQFTLISIDNEKAFGSKPSKFSLVFGLPQSTITIMPSVHKLIMSWNLETLSSFDADIKTFGGDEFTHKRVKALQDFLTVYPKANMRDIFMLAFFNTPTSFSQTLGLVILKELSFTGFWYYLKCNLMEMTSFKDGFKESLHSYLNVGHAFTILNQYLKDTIETERTLGHFVSFILNHPMVEKNKELISAYLDSLK